MLTTATFIVAIVQQGGSGTFIDIGQVLNGKHWVEVTAKEEIAAMEQGFKSLLKHDAAHLKWWLREYLRKAAPKTKDTTDPKFREAQIEYQRRAIDVGILNRVKFAKAAATKEFKKQWFGPAPELEN